MTKIFDPLLVFLPEKSLFERRQPRGFGSRFKEPFQHAAYIETAQDAIQVIRTSDGAATLHAVNRLADGAVPTHEILQFAAKLGSDVAFLASGAAWAEYCPSEMYSGDQDGDGLFDFEDPCCWVASLPDDTTDAMCALADSADPYVVATRNEALTMVEAFADTLDEKRRVIFVLAELEQMPVMEVAATLGMNANTVYSRLKVIKQNLKSFVVLRLGESRGEIYE